MTTDTVFFSYARTDAEFALRLAKDLRAHDIAVWFDQLDIAAGTIWDAEVQAALKRSKTLLVVLTPSSVESRNVMDEVYYALDHGQRLIPVLAEQCEIPFRLRRVQFIDFTGDYATALERAVREMKVRLSRPITLDQIEAQRPTAPKPAPQPAPSPAPAPVPVASKSSRWPKVGAIIGVVLVLLYIIGTTGDDGGDGGDGAMVDPNAFSAPAGMPMVRLTNVKYPGECLAVSESPLGVFMARCDFASGSQAWGFDESSGTGIAFVMGANCLAAEGELAKYTPCGGSASAIWRMSRLTEQESPVRIETPDGTLCLDAVDRLEISVLACDGTEEQAWSFASPP